MLGCRDQVSEHDYTLSIKEDRELVLLPIELTGEDTSTNLRPYPDQNPQRHIFDCFHSMLPTRLLNKLEYHP